MNFLAPLFLLGGLAIAGPVVLHLIRRTTREVTAFSSLMFLQPSPPRVTRRSRVENWGLLLLRCLVVGLLALGFARPFLSEKSILPAVIESGRRTVILVDTSASMRREGLWSAALERAGTLLREARPGDDIALLTFDRQVQVVLDFAAWAALPLEQRAPAAARLLAAHSPSWAGTSLDRALVRAAELFQAETGETPQARRIVVLSDLQEGARVEGLQGYRWPRGVEVSLDPLPGAAAGNASLQWIADAAEAPASATAPALRLRVTNAVDARQDRFSLRATDAAGGKLGEVEAYVPAGQSRVVPIPLPAGTVSATLRLTGDPIDFDNTLHLLQPPPAKVPLLFLGTDAETDPRASLYYLRRAFPATRQQTVELTAPRSEEAVPAAVWSAAQLLILGEGVPAAALPAARDWVRAGRIALLPLATPAAAITLGALLEVPPPGVTEAPESDYALLGQIDFAHPLFAPFADPRF